MLDLDDEEREFLDAYDSGQLTSIASIDELDRFKAAAIATMIQVGRSTTHGNDETGDETGDHP